MTGASLKYILKDETLNKLFLTICSMCSICVGSSVSAIQKRDLTKAINSFATQGRLGYVVSVVSAASDKYASKEADVSIGLSPKYQQSDILASADI